MEHLDFFGRFPHVPAIYVYSDSYSLLKIRLLDECLGVGLFEIQKIFPKI